MPALALAPFAETSRAALAPDWTALTQLPGPSARPPRVLAYASGSGRAQVCAFDPSTRQLSPLWEAAGPQRGASAVVPFHVGGRPHCLAYSAEEGTVSIGRIDLRSKRVDRLWRSRWGPTWTSVVPFRLGGRPYYLTYRPSDGAVTVDRIDSRGASVVPMWNDPSAPWETGWSTIIAFSSGGRPHYLAYRGRDGLVATGRFLAGGVGAERLWDNRPALWDRGWAWFVPIEREGHTSVVRYRLTDGAVRVDRVAERGLGVETVWEGSWEPWYSAVIGLDVGGDPYLVAYNRASGATRVERFLW